MAVLNLIWKLAYITEDQGDYILEIEMLPRPTAKMHYIDQRSDISVFQIVTYRCNFQLDSVHFIHVWQEKYI